jgi:hypothetical protein
MRNPSRPAATVSRTIRTAIARAETSRSTTKAAVAAPTNSSTAAITAKRRAGLPGCSWVAIVDP